VDSNRDAQAEGGAGEQILVTCSYSWLHHDHPDSGRDTVVLDELDGLNFIDVTAGCVSIGRFRRDTAPIRCLPFDHIGARHLGTPASTGSYLDLGRLTT